MANRNGFARLAGWLFVLSIFALGGISAWSLIGGDLGGAAIAAACLAALLARPRVGIFAAALAALLGAWPVAGLTLLTALITWSRALAMRLPRRRRPPDREALTAALAALPKDLLYAARVRAGRQPLTTWHLVTAAQRAKPSLWDDLLEDDPGAEAWDGPVLDLEGEVGTVTVFFAEAAGLGAAIASRQQREIDLDLLAVAASAIPLSIADEWCVGLEPCAERVLGMSLVDMVETLTGFAATGAGRDIDRRAQVGYWGRRLMIDDREFVFDLGPTRLPRLVRSLFSS